MAATRYETIIAAKGGWIAVVVDIPATMPRGMVLICHGLTGDRTGPQRLLTTISAELAGAGILAIRFDFRGSGDSSGAFSDTSFASMQADLETVLHWAQSRYSGLALAYIGLSIGGVIPALIAPRHKECRAVVLLSSDLVEGIRFDISGQVSLRGGQFELPEAFFREREQLYPRSALDAARIPVCLFYGAHDHKLEQAVLLLEQAGIVIKKIEGVDHLFEDAERRRKLSKGILAFLRHHLAYAD